MPKENQPMLFGFKENRLFESIKVNAGSGVYKRVKAKCDAEDVGAIFSELENTCEAEVVARVMRPCGHQCIPEVFIERAKSIHAQSDNMEDFLARLSEIHIAGRLHIKDGKIIAAFDKCFCIYATRISSLSPLFCHCSEGWYEKLFSSALGKPVAVNKLRTVMNGDDRCEFEISYQAMQNATNITYSIIDESGLDAIGPLWRKLNELHGERSPHFTAHFDRMTFEIRKQELLEKANSGHFRIELAADEATGETIGFCVSSVSLDKQGEIDSIYIEEAYRRAGIGSEMVRRSLAWMDTLSVTGISVIVALGNEEAFPFYNRFGLQPAYTTLRKQLREDTKKYC